MLMPLKGFSAGGQGNNAVAVYLSMPDQRWQRTCLLTYPKALRTYMLRLLKALTQRPYYTRLLGCFEAKNTV